MQWNQPCGQVAFESFPNNVYYQTIPPSRAIGEGEVTSIYIPDGSTQMYFIPTTRYERWSPHQYNINIPNVDNFHKNLNTEYWFVKSVSFPIPTGFNNQSPNPCGNYISTQPFTPTYSTNVPINQTDYYQKVCLANITCSFVVFKIKPARCIYNLGARDSLGDVYNKFHNDNATSTTDITYFYPSLRPQKTSQNSALVQTNKPSANYEMSYNGVSKCPCKVSFRVEKEISSKCMCQGSVSSMSVDSVKSTSSQRSVKSKEIHRSSKRKGKSKRTKHRGHICKYNNDVKKTSDKLVTTYMDKASGHVELEGRDTQTARNSKRSDIKTEIWTPINNIKRKSRPSSDSSTKLMDPCYGFTTSDDCGCLSFTDTDSQ